MFEYVTVISPYNPEKVATVLKEQVDPLPSPLRCLISLNAHYFSGTAVTCGTVSEAGFELRNRRGPFFSLRARGRFLVTPDGTRIEISFTKPFIPDFISAVILHRYENDRKVILNFLKEWIKAKEAVGV